MRRPLAAVAAVATALGAAGIAGCGDDDGGAGGPATPPATEALESALLQPEDLPGDFARVPDPEPFPEPAPETTPGDGSTSYTVAPVFDPQECSTPELAGDATVDDGLVDETRGDKALLQVGNRLFVVDDAETTLPAQREALARCDGTHVERADGSEIRLTQSAHEPSGADAVAVKRLSVHRFLGFDPLGPNAMPEVLAYTGSGTVVSEVRLSLLPDLGSGGTAEAEAFLASDEAEALTVEALRASRARIAALGP